MHRYNRHNCKRKIYFHCSTHPMILRPNASLKSCVHSLWTDRTWIATNSFQYLVTSLLSPAQLRLRNVIATHHLTTHHCWPFLNTELSWLSLNPSFGNCFLIVSIRVFSAKKNVQFYGSSKWPRSDWSPSHLHSIITMQSSAHIVGVEFESIRQNETPSKRSHRIFDRRKINCLFCSLLRIRNVFASDWFLAATKWKIICLVSWASAIAEQNDGQHGERTREYGLTFCSIDASRILNRHTSQSQSVGNWNIQWS